MPAYTWTTGEVITAAKLQALENEAWNSLNILAVGTTTASQDNGFTTGSWVNIDPSVNFTPQTSSVLVAVIAGSASHSTTSTTSNLGVRVNNVDYTISGWNYGTVNAQTTASVAGAVPVTGLTPGTAYTAQTRLSTSGGVITLSTRLTLIVLGIGK